jgi:hypothetical protein
MDINVFRFVIGTLVFSIAAYADPSITTVSGTLSHGSSLTIQGSRFLTKPTAAPQKFDSFSNGAVGAPISNGWNMTTSGSAATPTYDNQVLRHSLNTRSARSNFVNQEYLSSFGLSARPWIANGLYFDIYYYLKYGGTDGVDFSRNHKFFRIHARTDLYPNLYMAFWNPTVAS